MIENVLWTGAPTIQRSGFVFNPNFRNCRAKEHRACFSKKPGVYATSSLGNKTRGKCFAPRNGDSETKEIFGLPSSTTRLLLLGTNKPKMFFLLLEDCWS